MSLLNLLEWNYRTALAAVGIGFVVICCGCMFLTNAAFLGGGNGDVVKNDRVENDIPASVPDTNDTDGEIDFGGSGINIGNIVAAASIDRDGCPTNVDDSFGVNESIYIASTGSEIPVGTNVFVRLFYENDLLEDAPEIEAPQDYDNVCVSFVFEPETGTIFDPGDYLAQMIVNGSIADEVEFTVR